MAKREVKQFHVTSNLPPGTYVKPDFNLLLRLFPEFVDMVAKGTTKTEEPTPCKP